MELIYLAQELHIPIAEVPVQWREVPGMLTSVPCRHCKLRHNGNMRCQHSSEAAVCRVQNPGDINDQHGTGVTCCAARLQGVQTMDN